MIPADRPHPYREAKWPTFRFPRPARRIDSIVLIALTCGLLVTAALWVMATRFSSQRFSPSAVEAKNRLKFIARTLPQLPIYAWNHLTAHLYYPSALQIPIVRLHVLPDNLRTLDEELPLSGTHQFVKALLESDGQNYSVEARYRGNSVDHFFLPKKSWRLDFKPGLFFQNTRTLNLVVPKTKDMISEILTTRLAAQLGVLSPPIDPVALEINFQYAGFYRTIPRPDRYFLTHNRRIADAVLDGDLLDIAMAQGFSLYNRREGTYADSLWSKPSYWQIQQAVTAKEIVQNRFAQLLAVSRKPQEPAFSAAIDDLLDVDAYLQFVALMQLGHAYHTDYYHNHKFGYDPAAAKFYPIEWDLMMFEYTIEPNKTAIDLDLYPLLLGFLLSPEYLVQKNRVLWQAVTKAAPVEQTLAWVDALDERIRPAVFADPNKYVRVPPGGEVVFPVTNGAYRKAVGALKNDIQNQYARVRSYLEATDFTVSLYAAAGGTMTILLENHQITPLRIVSLAAEQREMPLAETSLEALGAYEALDSTDPNQGYVDKTLHPKSTWSLWKVPAGTAVTKNATFHVVVENTLTRMRQERELSLLAQPLPELQESHRAHLQVAPYLRRLEPLRWQGVKTLRESFTVRENQALWIEAGTKILLAPGVSLQAFGPIHARGTAAAPIQFRQLGKSPWGVVALQGAGAKQSEFQHTDFSGGSSAQLGAIRYEAMLNVHNGEAEISESRFALTQEESGTPFVVSFKQSTGSILGSHIQAAQGAGLSLQASVVDVENNLFLAPKTDGIVCQNCGGTIRNNLIDRAGGSALRFSQWADADVQNNWALRSFIGLSLLDSAKPNLSHLTIKNCQTAVLARQESKPFSGVQSALDASLLADNARDFETDSLSAVSISPDVKSPDKGARMVPALMERLPADVRIIAN